jgi:hypothetical protein
MRNDPTPQGLSAWRGQVYGDAYPTELDERIAVLGAGSSDALIYVTERYETLYLRLKADDTYFTEMRKVILCGEMDAIRSAAEEEGEKMSEAKAENLARKSAAYRNHLIEHHKCQREMAEIAPKFHSRRALIEANRMKTAFLRTELQQTT